MQKHQENLLPIHEKIYEKLDYFYKTNKIPHIIFHGSSGSGKRTIVDMFLNKIYQNDHKKIKTNVMFVNCAHGKGIKFIREELKFFAKTNIQANSGVLFKTIVLINADNLTIDAQSALRRCIELFSSNTRFFIIVENKQKLLNPILSRFCEIYVPEHIIDGKVVNLHQYNLKTCINLSEIESENESMVKHKMEELFQRVREHRESQQSQQQHVVMIDYASFFYENGLSCLDIIKWLEQTELIDSLRKYDILLYFNKIKSEYRCEKLLMLCVFDSIFQATTLAGNPG
jgi:Cdc6-like AAA superfamily ATPase